MFIKQAENIIARIKELMQELANQDIDNPYLLHHKEKTIDDLAQNLMNDHGYKDKQAVFSIINELFEKEANKHWELETEYEKREAEAFRQEQMKKMQKSPEKIPARKRRGHKM